jgi:hypothetical protein
MTAPDKYELRIGDRDEDEHHHVYLTVSGWKNSFNADCNEYFEMSGICRPERAQAIVTAVNSYSALQARVEELEAENERLMAALRSAHVAMKIASALPNVYDEYDFSEAISEAEVALLSGPSSPVASRADMEAALKFYADPANYINSPSWDGDPECFTQNCIPVAKQEGSAICDCGDVARAALGNGGGNG